LEQIIVIEDGPYNPLIQPLIEKYPFFSWLFTGETVGLLKTLDIAYSTIETKWIFQCSDQWVFLKPGFIEDSITYMNERPDVLQFHLAHKTSEDWDE